ncbi:MAG: PAS domain-containing protein, partial [Thermoleophilia bacterium]|nr:PAS domain-containing protein [Thermoleophilia bacterium]
MPELEPRGDARKAELDPAEESVEAPDALLETIVDRIPAGLIVAAAPSGRITRINDQARAVLGAVPLAQSVSDYSAYAGFRRDGSPLQPHEWPLARAVAGETIEREQIEFVRADGTRVLLEVSATPVRDRRGDIIAAVCLFGDVTEREHQERMAREFTTNAAHELRTPLAAIVSAVDVLQAGAKDLPHERDRFLAHIEREADRLSRLTRSLLVLARAQRRTEAARLEVVELCSLLGDVVAELRTAPGVDVQLRCEPQVAALANRDLTEQAVANLVANAARYTARGR